jgi:hypothetical protein
MRAPRKHGPPGRAYRSDFEIFRCWCEAKHVPALPAAPEAVSAFLATEATRGAKRDSSDNGRIYYG